MFSLSCQPILRTVSHVNNFFLQTTAPRPPGTKTPPPPASASNPVPALSSAGRSGAERLILENLGGLCEHYSQDIHFTFMPPSKGGVDQAGSFLRSGGDEELDFFDMNERGEIVLQPRPPIFPEEFPRGMKEHSLSWWGILDPALGDGRFRTPSEPREQKSNGDSVDHREPRSNIKQEGGPPQTSRNPKDTGPPYGGRRGQPRNNNNNNDRNNNNNNNNDRPGGGYGRPNEPKRSHDRR
jgi:hypothetical protein